MSLYILLVGSKPLLPNPSISDTRITSFTKEISINNYHPLQLVKAILATPEAIEWFKTQNIFSLYRIDKASLLQHLMYRGYTSEDLTPIPLQE